MMPKSTSPEKSSDSIQLKVEHYCLRQGLFPCRRLLIALSGGADSVTLLHLMRAIQPKFGYSLAAMHIHHGIRGEEADRDEDFCRSLCKSLGIDFHSSSIDVPALAAAEHRGLEETARHYRYAALFDYADQIGADRIATAHTATDQIETILMQLVRGSATAGGIRPMRGKLIRPLLEVTRAEILAYTAENALDYVEDSTNADDRYTRNFIRHTVIPALQTINPKAEEAFGRFAELRQRESDFLDREAMRRLNCGDLSAESLNQAKNAFHGASPAYLPINQDLADLRSLPSVLRTRAIAQLCEKGGISGLSHAHFEAIDKLIVQGRQGSSLSLPSGTICVIDKGQFCLRPASPECEVDSTASEIEPFILQPGENRLPDGSIIFAYTKVNESTEKYIKEKQNIYKLLINTELDFGKISNVIRVRSRKAGDRILCGSIHRKVKKCFCDLHIPLEKRSLEPILCDDERILWIPALRMRADGLSPTDLTPQDQILRLVYLSDPTE